MTARSHILLAAVAGIALGYGLARAPQWLTAPRAVPPAVAATTAKPAAGHQLLDEVVGRIRREYVQPVPDYQPLMMDAFRYLLTKSSAAAVTLSAGVTG